MSSPTPPQVSQGKTTDQHFQGGKPRPFFCRSCGEQQMGINVPAGWYSLGRHTGRVEQRVLRLGVYCSIECLQQQLPRIAGVAAEVDLESAVESPHVLKQNRAHRNPHEQ